MRGSYSGNSSASSRYHQSPGRDSCRKAWNTSARKPSRNGAARLLPGDNAIVGHRLHDFPGAIVAAIVVHQNSMHPTLRLLEKILNDVGFILDQADSKNARQFRGHASVAGIALGQATHRVDRKSHQIFHPPQSQIPQKRTAIKLPAPMRVPLRANRPAIRGRMCARKHFPTFAAATAARPDTNSSARSAATTRCRHNFCRDSGPRNRLGGDTRKAADSTAIQSPGLRLSAARDRNLRR